MPRITDKADLSHGTEFSVNTGTKVVTLSEAGNLSSGSANGVVGRQLYSAFSDYWKSGAGLNAFEFPFTMADGPIATMLECREGWTISGISFLRDTGLAYYNTSDVLTDAWAGFVQLGTLETDTDQPYYIINGTTRSVFGVADEFNECIKIYESGSFDYRASPVAKFFNRTAGDVYGGYDLITEQSISELTYRAYFIPMSTSEDSSISVSAPTGSPYSGMTLTLGATTETIDSIVGGNASYNFAVGEIDANGGTVQEIYDWFQDLLLSTSDIDSGAGTERGDTYLGASLSLSGGVLTTSQGLVITGAAGADQFNIINTDDTGTGRQKVFLLSAEVSNLPTDGGEIRLQIYNNTTDSQVYNDDPSSATYTATYNEGTGYNVGDEIRVRFAELNGSTSFKYMETIVTATSTGWSVNASNFLVTDSVYATNAVDGSAITKFNYSPTDDHFNLVVASNWAAPELFAFYCMTLTTAGGIEGAFGAFEAENAGNYKNITSVASIYLDNETTGTQRQTDSARVYRDDEAYPVLDPTTSGFGIDVNWKNVVYVVSTGGSALTAGESAALLSLPSATNIVDEMETQMQNDPTGFQVNVKEMNDNAVIGTGQTDDKWRATGVEN